MIPAEQIETPRLLLRKPVAPDDAPRIFASYASDPQVTRFLTWRPHYDLDDAVRTLHARLARWQEGREYSWAITTKADGAIIGMVSANNDGGPWRYEIGYVLARSHWGHGLMTEAAQGVVTHLLAQPSVRRVWAVADRENTASIRVLEKVGMQCEGLLRRWSVHPALGPEPRDCRCFATVH